MVNKLSTQINAAYKRHYRLVAAFMVGIIVAISYGLSVERLGNGGDVILPSAPVDKTAAISTSTPWLTHSPPQLLRIPKLNIIAGFERPLGIGVGGTVEVPESNEEVGWYKYGPTPGEIGPAVILGHVDSHQGPAVFYSLGQLKVGDEIFVDREDGTTAIFAVTKVSRYGQSEFPTVEVYGDIDHAGLRLITCSGIYNRNIQRYSHNLVVFAEMVSE